MFPNDPTPLQTKATLAALHAVFSIFGVILVVEEPSLWVSWVMLSTGVVLLTWDVWRIRSIVGGVTDTPLPSR